MCSDCGEIQCSYCGEDCGGCCPDDETCPLCWTMDHYGEADEEAWDYCAETDCDCSCHDDMDRLDRICVESMMGENVDETEMDTVMDAAGHVTKPKTNQTAQGIFPFMTLPTELRNKIYKYVLKQSGDLRKRSTPFLKGTIDTAILYTCRQINREGMRFIAIPPISYTRLISFIQHGIFLLQSISLHSQMLLRLSDLWRLQSLRLRSRL